MACPTSGTQWKEQFMSEGIETLSDATFDEHVKSIAKLNIDANLDVTRRYEVMSIPTMILFKDGEPQLRIVGARGKAQLLQELQAYL